MQWALINAIINNLLKGTSKILNTNTKRVGIQFNVLPGMPKGFLKSMPLYLLRSRTFIPSDMLHPASVSSDSSSPRNFPSICRISTHPACAITEKFAFSLPSPSSPHISFVLSLIMGASTHFLFIRLSDFLRSYDRSFF